MWIVILFLGVFSVTSFCNMKNNKVAYGAFWAFALVYCLREETGVDWSIYENYYNNIHNAFIVNGRGFEKGFYLLNLVFANLGLQFKNMIFVIGMFNCLLFFKATRKYTNNFGIAILIAFYFFFYPSFETLRTSISIMLFYVSLEQIDSDVKKYTILNVLGFFFHRSAIISFVFLIFHKYKKFRFIFPVSCLGINLLWPIINKIIVFLPKTISARFQLYFIDRAQNISLIQLVSLKLIECIIIVLILHFVIKKNYIEKLAEELLLVGIWVTLFMGSFTNMYYRFTYYSDVALIIVYSNLYSRLKSIKQKILYVSFLVGYTIIRFIRIL